MTLKAGDGERGRETDGVPAGGNREILCARLKEQIDQCETEFEAKKWDSFEGTILKAKLDMLQVLCGRLENGEAPGELLGELYQLQKELEDAGKKEEISATFDWYDEHYYYKIYAGQLEACKLMVNLLESWKECCD